MKTLPIEYTKQRKAWINYQIFIEKYDNKFIPLVKKKKKKHEKEIAKSQKIYVGLR